MEMLDSVLTSPPSAEQKKTRPAGLQRRANRVCEVTRPDTKRIIRGQPGHWFCEHNQLRLILTRRNRNSNVVDGKKAEKVTLATVFYIALSSCVNGGGQNGKSDLALPAGGPTIRQRGDSLCLVVLLGLRPGRFARRVPCVARAKAENRNRGA